MQRKPVFSLIALLALLLLPTSAFPKGDPFDDKFRQLDELLPTPTTYRNAAGAPGHEYWQQQADYDIKVSLDDEKQRLTGEETITYHNNSPDSLSYLWLQLDQNRFRADSDSRMTLPAPDKTILDSPTPDENLNFKWYRDAMIGSEFQGGYDLKSVTDQAGRPLDYVVNQTMMRIDLEKPLGAGGKLVFKIAWTYQMHEQKVLGGRSGYEYFEEDGNYLYEVAQWFPRMAAYYDVYGWQNKQFLGRGEFTLEFGDYRVEIDVPADHIVASTGVLQNPKSVLSSEQRKRLKQAEGADCPAIIVSEKEAIEKEKQKLSSRKTWIFKADNVRDFAWASSRKFIWDAQGYEVGSSNGLAMSYYPKEGNPIWGRYSTEAIIHTIEHYNKYSLEYPYPTAISVNGPVGGMEYPMISFNGPRPEKDEETGEKTYSRRTKYGLISVIIHEVGHNYYPMTINSDERQWTWMDEGFNTFVQFLAEQAWEEKYPSRRGEARNIVDYMKTQNQVPIMTNSESILQFGNNAYGKPATAFNILRETIMGRELFDFAFKKYAERWKFKRPTPSDFFRTMEDASGVDLDWFWRGWFYTTDHVDLTIDKVTQYGLSTWDPEVEQPWKREQKAEAPTSITEQRNRGTQRKVDTKPELKDYYNENDEFTVTNKDLNQYDKKFSELEDWQKELIKNNKPFYLVEFSNLGGLVMPIILEITYIDDSTEVLRIPAEIWRFNPGKVSKMLFYEKEIKSITLDPYWETADIDVTNNHWPRRPVKSRLELYKEKKEKDLMKESMTERERPEDENGDENKED